MGLSRRSLRNSPQIHVRGFKRESLIAAEAAPTRCGYIGVRRIAALVVAPTLDESGLLAALRQAMDPVFLPRRLRFVARLPRNETGKVPREQLLALLGAGKA
jgi:acyl-coenzyme A synthetase/AMP-(fatty) acid ligase